MKPRKLYRTLFMTAFILLIISCNISQQRVSGQIAMVGHEPFHYISVRNEKGVEFKIVGPLAEKLAGEYQGKSVILTGTVSKQALGPGFPAEFTAVRIKE